MAAGSTADELAALYPAPRTVTIAGRAVTIQQPTLRRCAHYDQLAAALWALGDSVDTPDGVLFEEHPEAAADMLAAVFDVEREWLVALPALRKVDLFSAWMEFNADFLSDRLQTMARLQKAGAAFHGAGPTPSHTLPPTESPTQAGSPPGAPSHSKMQSPAPKGASGAPA